MYQRPQILSVYYIWQEKKLVQPNLLYTTIHMEVRVNYKGVRGRPWFRNLEGGGFKISTNLLTDRRKKLADMEEWGIKNWKKMQASFIDGPLPKQAVMINNCNHTLIEFLDLVYIIAIIVLF